MSRGASPSRAVRTSRAARLLLSAATVLLLGACTTKKPVTKQAHNAATAYSITFFFAVVVFVGVVGVLLYCIVKFRMPADDDGSLPPQTHGNTLAEIIWTALPTVLVLVLFAISYAGIRAIDKPVKASDRAVDIVVRGYQWFWTFDYGDGVIIKNTQDKAGNIVPPEMVVPIGKTVHIIESSDNVIHSFFVPDFLFKRDVVPGRHNEFNFNVEIPGRYTGQCAEFCGTGHAKMNFTLRALGYDQFLNWFQDAKKNSVVCPPKPSDRVTISSVAGQTLFKQTCVVVAAGKPVTLTFDNGGGLPHNVAVTKGTAVPGPKLANTPIITSGAATVTVPPQPKGDYTFYCEVHTGMTGKYRVQ